MSKRIKIFAVLTLGLYVLPLAQSISTIGVYLNNLSYISSELCVNRDVPEMHCEGTCVLAQMMNNENKIPPSPFGSYKNSIQLTEIPGFLFNEEWHPFHVFAATNSPNSFNLSPYNYEPFTNIDRPPESLV